MSKQQNFLSSRDQTRKFHHETETDCVTSVRNVGGFHSTVVGHTVVVVISSFNWGFSVVLMHSAQKLIEKLQQNYYSEYLVIMVVVGGCLHGRLVGNC